MKRSALHGRLQSGCGGAAPKGFHHPLLASGPSPAAGFFIAFFL